MNENAIEYNKLNAGIWRDAKNGEHQCAGDAARNRGNEGTAIEI